MRLYLFIILLTAMLTLPTLAQSDSTKTEVRAMWVARWSITKPEDISRIVELAKKYGFNTLIVQIRGRGDAFYKSRLEPRAEDLKNQPVSFDPLAEMLKEAHANNIKVHAWINTYYTWSAAAKPVSPEHIVNKHPNWLMRDETDEISWKASDQVEGAYADPANPEVKQFLKSVFLDIAANYDVDGIHFDFVRYPSRDYCYCDNCTKAFADYIDTGLAPEEKAAFDNHPLKTARALAFSLKWDNWRREQVTELVRNISSEARKLKPNLQVSAAVFANSKDAYEHRFQDWKRWLNEGLLDFICPMAYSKDTKIVEQQILDTVQAAGKVPVYAGLGAWQNTPESTLEKISRVRSAGAKGIVLFSYGGVTADGTSEEYIATIQKGAFNSKP